jgi:hypothetical protein
MILKQSVCQVGLETVRISQIRAKRKPGYWGGHSFQDLNLDTPRGSFLFL